MKIVTVEYRRLRTFGSYQNETVGDVAVCCFHVAMHGSRTWRKRWAGWLAETWAATGSDRESGEQRGWWGDWETIPLPPTREDRP